MPSKEYTYGGETGKYAHRPAIIVRVWTKDAPYTVNLQVFTDGYNDGQQYASGIYWATSATYDPDGDTPYRWHWPERA